MFRRTISRVVRSTTQRRNMGGHAPPPQDGLDGMVRKYLLEDPHVVLGILGLYTSLYLISKLVFGGKKKTETKETAAVVTTSSGSMPSVDSPEFASWLEKPENIEKLFA